MSFGQYKDQVKRTVDNGSIAFEISDEDLFYQTGYKVIQNFASGGLIRAMSTTLNGRIRLVYDVSELTPLSTQILTMDPEMFKNFSLGLIVVCDAIKANGFIHGENVLLDSDMVFLNPITYQVNLIYLPLKQSISMTVQLDSLEKNVIELIRNMLKKYPNVQGDSTKALYDYLLQGSCNTSDIKEIILGVVDKKEVPIVGNISSQKKEKKAEQIPEFLILERIGGSQGLSLRIDAPAAVIGRDPAVSQVLVSDSSVSKKHCLICKESNGWKIEDLQSSNHTWLGEGGPYLEAYKQYDLKPGDVVKIARFVFQVRSGIGE